MTVRTRFAPSPTGFMHVGGVRTALFAWLFARKHGGQFILRIEDTDKAREIEGSIGHIIECLRWLGLEWDEGIDIGGPYEPYLQSSRKDSYLKYAQQLIEAGFAYPDPYTEEELEAFRKKAEEERRPFLFRDHRPADIGSVAWDGKTPLRFRVPEIKRYEWVDLVRGPLSASDGYPTYNFAHIVDDLEMKITHIMRSEEFISSTPKFLSLYDALDIKRPEFATMPVILGEGGQKKLGKRDGAKDLLDYRAEGYLPEAMVNFLALLGWNPGTEQEIFSKDELIEIFDLERVQKSGAMFNEEKLLFMNQQWMRKLSDDEFIAKGYLEAADMGRLQKAVPLLKERASTFGEAREMITGELSCLFLRPDPVREQLIAKESPSESGEEAGKFTAKILADFIPAIEELAVSEDTASEASIEEIKTALMPLADANPKEFGGRGAVLWPLRYALSGKERSPDPFSLIYILGKEESIMRIKEALGILD
jgi:glutamyl-tRNA synthetase